MPTTKTILLPIDITHPHPEFVQLLNELMPLQGTQVHLLYVREELPSMENLLRTTGGPDDFEKQVEEQAKSVLSAVQAELSKYGASVTQEITSGPAAMMIESVARDEGFDLTVLPPGGEKTFDRLLLGRVSSKVVRHAPGAVLVLRGDAEAKVTNVIFGLDGSEQSLIAMQQAAELLALAQKQVKVTLVNVVSIHPIFTMVSPISYISMIEGNLKMSGETILAEGDRVLSEMGIKNVEMRQVEGNPADAMAKLADETKANLIVVGALGKGVVEHFLMGSTSARLADHAHCSVAVFKGKGANGNAKS